MSSETVIHLVRHGQVHNPSRILYGRMPRFRLSDMGRQQARAAGQYLAQRPIAAVFASPLLRARQTAQEILSSFPGLRVQISVLLNEVCTAYEGLPGEQVDRRKGDIYTGVAECYEQPVQVFQRAHRFLQRMRRRFAGRQVAAVSHGDVITFAVLWALGREASPRNKTLLRQAGYPVGYPGHASVTSLRYNSADQQELPLLSYFQPEG